MFAFDFDFTHGKYLMKQPTLAILIALFFVQMSHAQQPQTLQQILDGQPVTVKAPQTEFGAESCQAVRNALLLTPKHIVYVINFTRPNAKGNCNVSFMADASTLETPAGTHRFVAAFNQDGKPLGWAGEGQHYLVYDRKGASEADAAQSVFNAPGVRTYEAFRRTSRSKHSQSFEVLSEMFQIQDKQRKESLDRSTQQLEAAGGVPAYFAKLNGNHPDIGLLRRLYFKTQPLPEGACSQGIYKTIAKLMANHETMPIRFSEDLTGWMSEMPAYTSASHIAQLNQSPNLDYNAFTVTDNKGNTKLRGLAIVASEDCKRVYLKSDYVGSYTNRKKYGKSAFSEIQTDFSGDFIKGRIINRYFSFTTDSDLKPYAGVLPAVEFLCAQDNCYQGTVESLFPQNVLKSSDNWPADIKAGIASLEQQRDKKLAQQKRERDIREAREAEQRRVAEAEAAKRQQAEERALNAALNGKDPQIMYLAAGKYEREGAADKAQQVYERLIERFSSSAWAVKANDQMLQIRRVEAVNSATRQANAEAGDLAYKACRIEMDSCYNRGGKDCYRRCDDLH